MKGIKYALLLAVVVRFSIGCLAGSVTGNGDVALCLTEPGRHDFVFDGREAIVVTPRQCSYRVALDMASGIFRSIRYG